MRKPEKSPKEKDWKDGLTQAKVERLIRGLLVGDPQAIAEADELHRRKELQDE